MKPHHLIVTLVVIAGIAAMALTSLGNIGQDRPKEGEPSINTPSHGVGVLFGSPKYQVKGDLVEGGFLDKQLLDEKGEAATPQTTPANTDPLKAPSHGVTSRNEGQ
ncbi:hypothetical protein E4188_23090 (plasmid) [Aeromonas media]|uniref:Uncharacterized protein n=2 Tax=Aeromonas TaxID=642 RepID=A0ABX6NYC2_AERME|nr:MULTISPECIES: hypothetical protein [Aeromonas]QJT41387.1 hypothetical protein E4188_23090 [Aeromonas media]QLI59223.1 hypothetical protein C0708_23090 [Aeromonas caviae]QLI60453.1 hypothetical protein C1C91_22740 [Aeromonas caviae]HDN9374626.1 hypothetical protein [Aeromonas salmonicida]HDN9378935.1 hypothetical protein [Aeromonas salmonicida]